jgi:hypothetical protein
MIVLSSQNITYLSTNQSTQPLHLAPFGKQRPPHLNMCINHRPKREVGYYKLSDMKPIKK